MSAQPCKHGRPIAGCGGSQGNDGSHRAIGANAEPEDRFPGLWGKQGPRERTELVCTDENHGHARLKFAARLVGFSDADRLLQQ